MAWAEKLPSGRYRGCYRDARGDRQSVKGQTFAHKTAAVRAASSAEEKARLFANRNPNASRQTWGEWVTVWWPTRDVEPSTLKVDKGRLERHLRPKWGTVPLAEVTRLGVKAWAADMKRAGVGPTTIQRCVHLLSSSLVAAMDAEVLDANPAARIKLPGSAKAQERYFTYDEYDLLHAQFATELDQLVADVLVGTGIRPGEGSGLHWNRVDLDRGIVRVVETYDETSGEIKPYPKGKRIRDVPITPELAKQLRAAKKFREEQGEDLSAGCSVPHRVGTCRSALVLTGPEGGVLRMSNWAYRSFKPALEHAGVGHARPYDFRHTYASWLLQQGIDLAVVGQLLGHVSSQTTQIYAHLAAPPNAAVVAALRAPRLPHAKGEGDGSERAGR